MKTKTTVFTMIVPLLLLVGGMGCEKENNNADCYIGKVIQIRGKCNDIIEITSAPKNGLPVGQTITFNPDLFSQELKIGSMIKFKIVKYEKWEGPGTADCIWPAYIGNVEPCKI